MSDTLVINVNETVVDTEFTIYYSTENFVPIPRIIDALKSIESMLNKTHKFTEAAYPGIKVYESQVFIDHLESGSLELKVLFRQILGDAKYERGAKLIEDVSDYVKEAVADSKVMNGLVIAGMAAIISAGATYAIVSKGSPPPSPSVTIVNNGIMNGSGNMVLSPEQIKEVVDTMPKKQIAKDAVNFSQPAKDDPNATIQLQNEVKSTQVSFDSNFIQAIPDQYEPPKQEEKEQTHSNVDVYIYASDRDNSNKGWAGSIPDAYVESRISFDLDESIDPNKLHGKRKIKADILVHSRFVQAKNKYIPYKATILKIA